MVLSEKDAGVYLNRLLREGTTLQQYIRDRRLPFHADESVGPKLAVPLNRPRNEVYQSDLPRQKWVELKSRLVANHGHVHITPPNDYTKYKKSTEALEGVLNAWW